MRTAKLKMLTAAVALNLIAASSALQAQNITVTAPGDGDELLIGGLQTILWQAPAAVENIRIEFSGDGGRNWQEVVASTSNDGSESVQIPEIETSDGKVRILNADSTAFNGESAGAFAIAWLYVDTPRNDERIFLRTGFDVEFRASPQIQSLALEFSADDGSTWQELDSGIANSGAYSWLTPDTETDRARIRLLDQDNRDRNAVSARFRLERGVEVLRPERDERILAGSRYTLLWRASGDIDSVRIQYSRDDGNNWQELTPATENDGVFDWQVPGQRTTRGKIRIADAADDDTWDRNNGNFDIYVELELIRPDGGEQVAAASDYEIRWRSSPGIDAVDIELSYNSGGSWDQIANDEPDDGRYTWQVGDRLSDNARIRILDDADRDVRDVSNSDFEIFAAYEIITPAPDAVLRAADSTVISWTATNNIRQSNIEFSLDDGLTWQLVASMHPGNRYDWLPPDTTVEGRCRLRLTNADDTGTTRVSERFSIRQPSLQVMTPNLATECWQIGRAQTVRWQSSGFGSMVQIEYSSDAGATWNFLIETENDSIAQVTAPASVTSQARIRVRNTLDGDDFSDTDFRIDYPRLSISTDTLRFINVFADSTIVRNYSNIGCGILDLDVIRVPDTHAWLANVSNNLDAQSIRTSVDAGNLAKGRYTAGVDVINIDLGDTTFLPVLLRVPNHAPQLLQSFPAATLVVPGEVDSLNRKAQTEVRHVMRQFFADQDNDSLRYSLTLLSENKLVATENAVLPAADSTQSDTLLLQFLSSVTVQNTRSELFGAVWQFFTPDSELVGVQDTLVVTADDGDGKTRSDTFAVSLNFPPIAVNTFSSQTLKGGDARVQLIAELSDVFVDPEDDDFDISAQSSADSVLLVEIAVENDTVRLEMTPLVPGVATVTLFAQEGNSPATGQTSFRVEVVRNLPPVIEHAGSPAQAPGSAVRITAAVSDDETPESELDVQLVWGEAGMDRRSFQSRGMNLIGGEQNFAGDIVVPASSRGGIEYYFTATDADEDQPATARLPEDGVFSMQLNFASDSGIVAPERQPLGTGTDAYRLISVPLVLENSRPDAVLEDQLGRYDPTVWRLFELNANYLALPQEPAEIYEEFPRTGGFAPGRALWLILKDPRPRIDSGPGTTVSTAELFPIDLHPGYNYIANPFNYPAHIVDTLASGAAVNALYSYDGGWSAPLSPSETLLQPFSGYLVLNPDSFNTTTLFVDPERRPGGNQLNRSVIRRESASGWRINIAATAKIGRDLHNWVGVHPEAQDGPDTFDHPEPLLFGDFVSVWLDHPEWQTFTPRYTSDMRAPADSMRFRVAVLSSRSQAVQLQFSGTAELPEHLGAWLIRPQSGIILDLKTTLSTQIAVQAGRADYYQLVIGEHTTLAAQWSSLFAIPAQTSLLANYPNPFNPATTLRFALDTEAIVSLEIYDIRGRKVRSVIDEIVYPAGRHAQVWDGYDHRGVASAAGLYFAVMTAGERKFSRKLLLVK